MSAWRDVLDEERETLAGRFIIAPAAAGGVLVAPRATPALICYHFGGP